MYNNGQLDGLFEITAKELRNVPNSELSTNSKILPSTAFMTFNHDNELMSNQDFRKAISIAIDREGVVNEVLASAGIPSKFLVPIIYQIAGEPFREFTELDDGPQIEEAKAIIQQLKDDGIYDGRTITFHYMLNGPDAEVSEYIIEQLERDLEIDFEVIGMAWADLYDLALNKDYDFLMMGWGADYPHPMTFLTMFEKDSFYHPITRWRDLEYEDMLADFLLIEDEKEGLNLLRTIEDRILDGYHVVPIYYRKGLSLINEKVKGWHQGSTVFDFTRAYIEE
jgi:oligopeptide transport system substrate-binding protein